MRRCYQSPGLRLCNISSRLLQLRSLQNTNKIGCRGFLAPLPALSAWYPSSVITHKPFIIYIVYQCPTGFNLKYCYTSTELSVYLKKLQSFKESGTYSIRSKTSCELKVPKTKHKTLGNRAFTRVGPSLWNTLPSAIRNIRSVQGFKQVLKTFLFRLAFA